jgi:hypothetical protein
MKKDPLSLFLNEKTAASSAPSTSMEVPAQKGITANPDRESLDPGERAMAGMAAGGGVIGGALVGFLADQAIGAAGYSGSVPVTRHLGMAPAGRLQDMTTGPTKSRVMGLFDVESRWPKEPAQAVKQLKRFWASNQTVEPTHRVANKILDQVAHQREVTNVVDSFIDKHNLAKKGVKIHLRQGPLSMWQGPRYDTITKEVHLQSVGKELALHELGHAADYTKGRIGKIRAWTEPMLRRSVKIALPAALVAGDRIAEILPGTVDDKIIAYMQDHAPEIMLATLGATELYPEAKASVLALKHIAKVEGRKAAFKSLGKLGPLWGSYALAAIPTIVGMSLARKYMREARGEKRDTEKFVAEKMKDLEKTAAFLGMPNPRELIKEIPHIRRAIASHGKDFAYVGKQITEQSSKLIHEPGTMKRLGAAAKEVGTDPSFAFGALNAAMPAALASIYLYGSTSGKEVRKRIDKEQLNIIQTGNEKKPSIADRSTDEWRERNPLLFAGLVAAGAAMSGGIMTKLFADFSRVL